jgi:long-chain acyl-CoA synthetase
VTADVEPTPPAIHCGGRSQPLSALHLRAVGLAGGLKSLGVGQGDRVAVVLRNDIAFLEVSIAVGLLGASPVPVNWHWKGDELAYLLTDSGSKVVFAHTDLVPGVEAVLPPGVVIIEVAVAPDLAASYGLPDSVSQPTGRHAIYETWLLDQEPVLTPPDSPPLSVIYTSGTTGRPKGIIRTPATAEDRVAGVQTLMTRLGFAPGCRTMVPAPMYHTAPNVHAIAAVVLGMDLTVLPRFDPEDFLRVIDEHKIDHIQMVPTMFVRLLQLSEEVRAKYDVSSLQTVVHAAAPCPVEVKRQMIDWLGPVVTEYYGGSETGIAVWCDSAEWLAHPGTVGHPVDGSDIRVVGGDGEAVPTGEVGVVYIKPANNWPDFTYIGDDDKRRGMELAGYLTVGDMGRLDADGYLYLTDRANDMVISGGVNIYPAEIENVLYSLDGVRDVAVFGIPDEEYGEALAAHVDVDPAVGLTEHDVRAFVRERLAGYKVPKVVVFDDNLPREESGKLFKRRLRDTYWADSGRGI